MATVTPRAVVVLAWASWAAPSRPAATTAVELGRRHPEIAVVPLDLGEPTLTVPPSVRELLADILTPRPSGAFAPAPARAAEGAIADAAGPELADAAVDAVADTAEAPLRNATASLHALDADALLKGLDIEILPTWVRYERISGDTLTDAVWREVSRLVGAQPKHVVESELFGATPDGT